MLRAILLLTAALGCFSIAALAQPVTPPASKKAEAGKAKDDAKSKIDSKIPEKPLVAPKDLSKVKTPLEQMIDEWLEMKRKLDALERQLKPDRKPPSQIKLSGRLEGGFLVFRAVYTFSTESPRTMVPLGLQGGHLLDDADLDGQTQVLDYNKDDGFVALIEKEGRPHRLTVNFRVLVPMKEAAAGSVKRGIDLGLPGASVTIVNLELPTQIKELLWNDVREKTKTPGRWQIGLEEKSKSLSLSWKEPLSLTGNPPLAKADGQIKVDIDEKDVHITADLTLEDSRLQTKEWRLSLPASATIDEVKAPGGLTYQWIKPDEKTPYHILKTSDVTVERWQVTVSMHVPRPNPPGRVAIGPFHVLNASEHVGAITIKTKGDVSFGQRLVFVRGDKTYQKSADLEPTFRYVAPLVTEKNLKTPPVLKSPLELEWRFEKNYLESQVEHQLNLRTVSQGWEIDAVTHVKAAALFAQFSALDLKLPLYQPRGAAVAGTLAPGLGFPGCLPWSGMWNAIHAPSGYSSPEGFEITEESGIPLKVMPQDATGKLRIVVDRPPVKKLTLIVKTKLRVPASQQRVSLELPRPLGTQERSSTLAIKTDDRIELLSGPEGAEEPVPDRHRLLVDQPPAVMELAWRPHQPDIVAQGTIDVTLHENTAQVRQSLRFPRDPGETRAGVVAFSMPAGIHQVMVLAGGTLVSQDTVRHTVWVRPVEGKEDIDLVLQYDLAILDRQTVRVPSLWPLHASRLDAKVRVWSAAGTKVRLTDELIQRAFWKERSIERVEGVDRFPALVVQGSGSSLPLTIRLETASGIAPAAFIADRALIQVTMLDDGSQHCRARYLVKRVHGDHVDLELPLPLARFREPPIVMFGKKVGLEARDATEKTVRVKLHRDLVSLPTIFEVEYTIPTDALETSGPWRTTLQAPRFQSEVVIGQMRWQLSTPRLVLPVVVGRSAHADIHWSWRALLPAPESSVDSGDLELWLTGKETPDAGHVTFSFTHQSMDPQTVYHLPRQGWLIGCSGILLIVVLGGYFSPMSRLAYWLLLLALGVGVLTLVLLCPGAAAAVFFGLQPGLLLCLIFVGVHWLVQERYRRQLVFLPGFQRVKSGSTLARSNAAKRPREPSTIDAPPVGEEPATKSTGSST